MKNKIIPFLLALSLIYIKSYCQVNESDFLSKVLKNQSNYLHSKIKKGERSGYITLINLAGYLRPKVIQKIKQLNSIYFDNKIDFNMVEGYDLPSGDIYGLIWRDTDSVYYFYSYRSIGNTIEVSKKEYSQLDTTDKSIVSNFNDWNSPVYKQISPNMYTSSDPLHYLASKNVYGDIKTIAFCK